MNTQKPLAFLYTNNEMSEKNLGIDPIHHCNKYNNISRNKPT